MRLALRLLKRFSIPCLVLWDFHEETVAVGVEKRTIMRLALGMLIVAALHFVLGSVFYYGRTKEVSAFLDSDWQVFALPFIVALSGYFLVFWQSSFLAERTTWRIVLAIVLSLVAASISGFATFVFVLNQFGS